MFIVYCVYKQSTNFMANNRYLNGWMKKKSEKNSEATTTADHASSLIPNAIDNSFKCLNIQFVILATFNNTFLFGMDVFV